MAGTPGRRALGREIQRAERIERVKICEEVDLFYFVKYDAGRLDSKAKASLLLPMILNQIKVKQERNRSNTMSLRLCSSSGPESPGWTPFYGPTSSPTLRRTRDSPEHNKDT